MNLPNDVFMEIIKYLSFDDVINIASSNSKFHSICFNTKYTNKWKLLIDNTYSDIYDYEKKLNKIWKLYNLKKGTYNYIVYTQLIKFVDHITKLIIYYKKCDNKFYNGNKLSKVRRFLAMFILGKTKEMEKHKTYIMDGQSGYNYFSLLKGNTIQSNDINWMLIMMAIHGNIRGIKLFEQKGFDFHFKNDTVINYACQHGQLEVVKYLIKMGFKFKDLEHSIYITCINGHLKIVKYLVKHFKNQGLIFRDLENILFITKYNKHMDIVKYLESIG